MFGVWGLVLGTLTSFLDLAEVIRRGGLVQGFGFRVSDLGFGVWGIAFSVEGRRFGI